MPRKPTKRPEAAPQPPAPPPKSLSFAEMLETADKAGVQSVGEVIDHFFSLMGGQREVAKMLVDEFKGAKAGSLVRAKILDLVLKHLGRLEERAGRNAQIDLLSEDDILRELGPIVEKARAAREKVVRPALDPDIPAEDDGATA